MTKEELQLKGELIKDVFSYHNTPATVSVVKLIDFLIHDIRCDNDSADVEMFKRNQGRIEALKELRYYIAEGLRTPNRAQ
jgi:hypothetical protein